MTLRRSLTETTKGIHEKDPKTHRPRRLAIDPWTLAVLRAEQKRLTEHAARFDVPLASDPFVWSQDPDGASPWSPNRATYVF